MTKDDIKKINNNDFAVGKSYFSYNDQNYNIQIPKEVNENTVIYVTGKSNISNIYNSTKNDNVIIISPENNKTINSSNMNGIVNEISNAFNISDNNRVYCGVGDSFAGILRSANSSGKNTTVITNNSNDLKGLDNLDNSLIINISKQNTKDYELQQVARNGANVMDIEYTTNTSSVKDADISNYLSNFLNLKDPHNLNFINGNISLNDSNGMPITINDIRYSYYNSNGQKVYLSPEDARKYINGKSLITNPNSYYDNTLGYNKNISLSDYASKYNQLGFKGDTLGSNLSFVSDSMNGIINRISLNDDINYNFAQNSAGIIEAISGVGNYYNNIHSSLSSNLNAEASAIYDIADAIYQMDSAGAQIASTSLNDSIKGLYSSKELSPKINTLNKTYNSLVKDAKEAASTEKYNSLSNFLEKDLVAGNVGVVYSADLYGSMNKTNSLINSDMDTSRYLMSLIDSFSSGIGSSNILQGQVWDNVKTDLNFYNKMLEASIEAGEFISSTIRTAVEMLTDFIGSDGKIDDSNLPDLENSLAEVTALIEQLEQQVSNMQASQHEVCDTCGTGNETYSCNCRLVPSNEEIQAVKNEIAKQRTIKVDLEAQIKRIYDFTSLVNKAQSLINDAVSQVKNTFDNPVKGMQGNYTFNTDYKLDLSAYGIESEASYAKYINNYLNDSTVDLASGVDLTGKTVTGSTQRGNNSQQSINNEPANENQTTTNANGYNIDTSKMNDKAKEVLDDVSKNWPDDLEPERIKIVENALSLYGKGIPYSQGPERNMVDDNGKPLALDCSSFATKCMYDAGLDIAPRGYTGTYCWNNDFHDVSIEQLRPGDIALKSKATSGGNHIGIYLGKTSYGVDTWIDSTIDNPNKEIDIISTSAQKKDFHVFRSYNY